MATFQVAPLISIVVPVYNRKERLEIALKSILGQTYQNYEVLVVDDFSTENIEEVVEKFKDERFKYLRLEKKGNANIARNLGIKKAKGEFIAMLDSDDEFLPHHLERRLRKMKEWGCDGIFGSAYINDGDKVYLKLSRPLHKGETMLSYLLSDGFAPTPTHFYKRERALQIMWDSSLLRHQDFDFSIRFSKKNQFISDYEPTVLINWINQKNVSKEYHFIACLKFIDQHQNQLTRTVYSNYIGRLYQLAQKNSENKEILDELRYRINSLLDHISLVDYLRYTASNTTFKRILRSVIYILRISLNISFSVFRRINRFLWEEKH